MNQCSALDGISALNSSICWLQNDIMLGSSYLPLNAVVIIYVVSRDGGGVIFLSLSYERPDFQATLNNSVILGLSHGHMGQIVRVPGEPWPLSDLNNPRRQDFLTSLCTKW